MSPQELLSHYDDASPWSGGAGYDVAVAYEHALAVRELRVARGEKPLGYKVGFTNRNIWPVYQVFAPIWGTVYDSTVTFCEGAGEVSLQGTCQPRLEPECVFGLRVTPPARATLDDLFACIDWFAPGFEIVQSHQPGWKFVAADTVADGGLHARLLVGRKIALQGVARNAHDFEKQLSHARVQLSCGGVAKEEGVGANVLDGPLHALAHFLEALRDCPGAPDLQPGDIVTTGTWTDAWPVEPGQTWQASFDPPLGSLEIRFT